MSCSFLSGCLNVGREALEYVSNIASSASNIEYDTGIEVALSSMYASLVAYVGDKHNLECHVDGFFFTLLRIFEPSSIING